MFYLILIFSLLFFSLIFRISFWITHEPQTSSLVRKSSSICLYHTMASSQINWTRQFPLIILSMPVKFISHLCSWMTLEWTFFNYKELCSFLLIPLRAVLVWVRGIYFTDSRHHGVWVFGDYPSYKSTLSRHLSSPRLKHLSIFNLDGKQVNQCPI